MDTISSMTGNPLNVNAPIKALKKILTNDVSKSVLPDFWAILSFLLRVQYRYIHTRFCTYSRGLVACVISGKQFILTPIMMWQVPGTS